MWKRCGIRRVPAFALACLVVCVAVFLTACGPDAPVVERATLWMDTVKHGDFTKYARGPGNLVAKVGGGMDAELFIPESQSFDLAVDQPVVIDTRNGTVEGRVSLIANQIERGTVKVIVEILADLPNGVRHGLSIDGKIEITTIDDVLYVGKPAHGRSKSEVGLFKLVEDGSAAVRVPVVLGESSVNLIEVLEGLEEGDEIILSDMSRYDMVDRVLLR